MLYHKPFHGRQYYLARRFYKASNPEHAYMTSIFAYPTSVERDADITGDNAIIYETVSAGEFSIGQYNPDSPSVIGDSTIADVHICVDVPVTRREARKMCPYGYSTRNDSLNRVYSWDAV